MRKGVPHSLQNSRCPKFDEEMDFTLSAPWVQTKSPSGTLVKTMAGAPLLSWQVRQWHHPVSKGSLLSS
jgi:hypothetical protein